MLLSRIIVVFLWPLLEWNVLLFTLIVALFTLIVALFTLIVVFGARATSADNWNKGVIEKNLDLWQQQNPL